MAAPSPNPKRTAERQGELQGGRAGDLQGDLIWLGRLAHRLVHDPSLADDAAQDAWLRATRGGHTPADRPKLLGTLRSVLFNRRRGERRRRLHEGHASRSEAIPSTADLLIAGERSQILWRHLRGLDEPYRSTLLLRFGQDLETKAVAAHLDIPEDSVRWRLRKGLAQLKESLEQDEVAEDIDGDTGRGLRCLAPLALLHGPPAGAGAATPKLVAGLGLFVMLKYVIAACALVIAGVWFAREGRIADPIDPLPSPGRVIVAAAPGGAISPLQEAGAVAHRTSAPAALEPSSSAKADARSSPVAALTQPQLMGRAVDGDGRPVAGATVTAAQYGDWSLAGETDIGGAFAILCPVQTASRVSVTIERLPGYVTKTVYVGSSSSCIRAGLTVPIVDIGDVILTPGGTATGRVFDQAGHPIQGATLTAKEQGTYPWSPTWGPVESGPGGAFVLGGLPPDPVDLYVRRPGFLTKEVPFAVKADAPEDLGKIVLFPSEQITGTAVDTRGNPVPGATIRLLGGTPQDAGHGDETITGKDGSFALDLGRPGPQTVVAVHGDFRPSLPVDFEPGAHVTLSLGELGVPCRFKIVDAVTGAPLEPATFSLKERPVTNRAPLGAALPRVVRGQGVEAPPHSPGVVEALGLRSTDTYYAYVPGYHSREGRVTRLALEPGGQKIKLKPLAQRSLHGQVTDGGTGVPFAEVELQSLSVARFGPKDFREWSALPGVPEAARRAKDARHRAPRELNPRTADFLFMESSTARVRADKDGFFRCSAQNVKPVRAVARLGDGRVAVSAVRRAGRGDLDLGVAILCPAPRG